MRKRVISILVVFGLLILISVLGSADIAAKKGNLALFLKPSWTTGSNTSGHWVGRQTSLYPDFNIPGKYVPGTKAESHGGRKFYQYEDYAGTGILYTVKPSATGLPKDYKHKGTVVVSEIGWKDLTQVTAQDVWEIWEQLPDTYKYRKGGVTQIQLLSDDLFGVCYQLDNKYGTRDLRVLVYGALLTGGIDQDKENIREQIITAMSGDGLETKKR